jgi:hypothetical protein
LPFRAGPQDSLVGNKLGTLEAIGESWEGMVYTRVFLSNMRERLGAQGFDRDAYVADWESDLEHVSALGHSAPGR